ncbi:cupin domain-containing protein [Maricaulis sp.]|jgi:mannose-6-phosphate isomerase-like protein (cupin superfamily)|uniref:cupin domain-containing protein n=1 Tax=Maricaulis sp. TaxID=1486257 RepID=UPI000C4886E5|nr:cupin domain-containing protein [Maricaulis sp.]MAC88623.1 hypothetical protein [Maricaulis sp.]
MNKWIKYGLIGLSANLALPLAAQAQDSGTEAILTRFAADYLADPTFQVSTEFGVVVDGDWWTVSFNHDATSFSVSHGEPTTPTFYYTAEADTLAQVDRGEIAALTAMGKAFSSDYAPMDIELMDGAGFDPAILALTFHFWTRGTPEIINWRDQATREVHGGNVGIIYYQPGFRSGFGQVMPGQHVNEDPRSRTNGFPTLLVFTGNRAIARIDGVDQEVGNGQMILIPAGVSHEILNPFEEPAEFLLFMFGDGA